MAKATATILSSGEFAAGSCETVLLHAPAGFKAERILLVGLGKLTTAEVRKAAGAAVRFAKPRKLRELCIAIPGGARSRLLPRELWSKAPISAISIRIPIVPTAKTRASSN